MNNNIIKTIYSSEYIKNYINKTYNTSNIIDVVLVKSSINDIYKIKTDKINFIFKIYSILKTINDLKFEINYMLHLKSNNIIVSKLIKSKNNKYIVKFKSNEGVKLAILTSFIDGIEPLYLNNSNREAYYYGLNVAKLHNVSDRFILTNNRKNINIKELLLNSSDIIENYLIKCSSKKTGYFKTTTNKLVKAINFNILNKGYLHGDLHGGNVKFFKNDKIGFFDFEFCGYGCKIYDLATFKWGCMIGKRKNDWKYFMNGYSQVSSLPDIKYLLHFVSIRHIIVISLDIQRIDILGENFINDIYISKRIQLLEYINNKLFI